MMRALQALALAAAIGCGDGPPGSGEAATAASLADRIAGDPGAADAILEQEGMDRQRFEALLYEIAADPEATRAYLDTRREAFRNPYAPPRGGPSGQGTF